MSKTFQIYRSSAGSGKTRTLAKSFIVMALGGGEDHFRYIIAVTFANKATQEMKERILYYLSDFASGKKNNLSDEVMHELGLTEGELKRKSGIVLSLILHRYSQFNISTIDAFFQRVIRSFTREAGLLGNFRLEVDNDFVLDEVLGDLMDELGSENEELTKWITLFSQERLTDSENWNIVPALRNFAKAIFEEDFKAVEESILRSENPSEDNRRMLATLRSIERKFMADMKSLADKALALLSTKGIGPDDFKGKGRGTPWKYFIEFSEGREFEVNNTIEGAALSVSDWIGPKTLKAGIFRPLVESSLQPILKEMMAYNNTNQVLVKSATEVLKNFYAYGLISDITRKLKTYRDENNVMLLSDASKFLNGVINNSDTPFIYEKVGSYFRNYLIDEFQDTSGMQWKNLIPLLKEAADQNNTNFIVGDVKQSVYRWRGGDLELLQRRAEHELGKERVHTEPLNTNYRSAGKIVDFNNLLFGSAARIVSSLTSDLLPGQVYGDVSQKKSRWPEQGFVRVNFLPKGEEDEWTENAIAMVPSWLEKFQDMGARLQDIAILVRKNEEGQRVANYLLQFRTSNMAKPGYRYEVVSNESLRLDTSYSVNVLIAALRYMKNPRDMIAKGQLAYELAMLPQLDEVFHRVQTNDLDAVFPPGFIGQLAMLKKLSLFELTEVLIRTFKLGELKEELAYLQAFQDLVLEFDAREKTDVASFLEWWEMYKGRKSIKASETVDAVKIFTIHGAKGLQFKYVIVPLCNWGLNHDFPPLLWVSSEREPFNQLGALAVRYGTALDKTVFGDDYRKEFTKVFLDNLNLLYVAFTRAEQGLIVYAPEARLDKTGHVGELVHRAVMEDEELRNHFDGKEFKLGEIESMEGPRQPSGIGVLELERYASADWRNKLVIKREGAEFFEDTISEKRAKINRGILLHTVMSRIEYRVDSKEKLDNFFMENTLPEEDRLAIVKDVQAILDHPQMAGWFTKEWKIKAEALVLLPGGLQKRIDRIMLGKTRTVIVDYKTGLRKEADREQVELYAAVLTGMGYPNVQAYLVYLRDLKVEEVITKSNLTLF